jgi:hypothetical protein
LLYFVTKLSVSLCVFRAPSSNDDDEVASIHKSN